MRHHRECPDQACAICLPLRRRLAAAKVSVAAATASQPPGGANANRRKPTKRKKDEEDEAGAAVAGGKKRKGDAAAAGGGGEATRDHKKKRGSGASTALAPAPEAEAPIAVEHDLLESGFSVSVHFSTGKRVTADPMQGGEWRSGTVMRSYVAPGGHGQDVCYDIMMSEGHEEKRVSHSRCRMVCNVCLSDKRTFRPPPMFCEKCFTAIHQRWSYWEEGGEEGGLKLCKRCFSDIKASTHPNRLLCDLAHRGQMNIDTFVEKKEKDRPEYVDNWVQCDECHSWMHWTCGLYKGEDTPDDCLFFCDSCRLTRGKLLADELTVPPSSDLATDVLSTRLQEALRTELQSRGVACSPVTVRVVSNFETVTKFDQQYPPGLGAEAVKAAKDASKNMPVKNFPYRSKCVLAFQHVEGHEVCFFAMYVQEYGSDCPEPNTNRVYISYLDSVRYFVSSPEGQRTTGAPQLVTESLCLLPAARDLLPAACCPRPAARCLLPAAALPPLVAALRLFCSP